MSESAQKSPPHPNPAWKKVYQSWVSFILMTLILLILFSEAWWIVIPIIASFFGAIEITVEYLNKRTDIPRESVIPSNPEKNNIIITNQSPILPSESGAESPPADALFCSACGEILQPNQKKCPVCGFEGK